MFPRPITRLACPGGHRVVPGGGLSDTEFLDLLRLVPLRPATHRRDVVMGEVGGEGCCVAADGESAAAAAAAVH